MRLKYFILFMFFAIILLISIQTKQGATEQSLQTIPDDAIRLRILANSDSDADQQLKLDVRDAVNEQISSWVEQVDDINKAREIIENNIHKVQQTVTQVVANTSTHQEVAVQYKPNVTFPTKVYDRFVYPAGEYEAVLITLGDGEGANWWCVLFPPLCFLDFANGATVVEANDHVEDELEEEEEPVEVKFFLFKWLGWS